MVPERLPRGRPGPYIIAEETEPVIELPFTVLAPEPDDMPENDPTNRVAATVPETTVFPATPSTPDCELYVLQVVMVPDKLEVLPVDMLPTIAQLDSIVPRTNELPVTFRFPVCEAKLVHVVTVPVKLLVEPETMLPIFSEFATRVPEIEAFPTRTMLPVEEENDGQVVIVPVKLLVEPVRSDPTTKLPKRSVLP